MFAAYGGDGSSTTEVINATGFSPAGQYVERGHLVLALVGSQVNPEGPIIQAEQTNIYCANGAVSRSGDSGSPW